MSAPEFAADLPRRPLAVLPTPLHRLTALEALIGSGPLYLKRDDLTGFGLAGNKARALEYLLGDALAQGADILVTAGSPSSNFVAAAALAARVGGLDCEVLVAGSAPSDTPLTLGLARGCGANLRFTGADREELDRLVGERADRLRAEGRRPDPVPRGGATPVGALGFARAAPELAAQLARPEPAAQLAGPELAAQLAGLDNAVVVVPTGSGASLAGFLAGRAAIGATWCTYGVSVSRPAARIRTEVRALAGRCAALVHGPTVREADLHLVDAVGPGFGRLTGADRDHLRLALDTDGVLLDPTYGAKALTAVVGMVAEGERAPIVLWHGGGTPAALSLLATEGLATAHATAQWIGAS
jgi:D-cysteine desulfhydrase